MTDKELDILSEDGWCFGTYKYSLTKRQIEKYQDKLNWWSASQYYTLTNEQLIKYKKYIKPKRLFINKNISDSIKEKIEFGVFYE